VPDSDIPTNLIQLQHAFNAANAECERIAAALPSAVDVAAGRAAFTNEELKALREARVHRDRVGMDLIRHEWWATQGDLAEAKRRVRDAARTAES
jgi:hypothetical protein